MKKNDLFQSSVDYVYDEIRSLIMTKNFLPGQRLPEISIAKRLEVSRTPVREALRKLANEGLVVLIPNGGARLASPSKQEIQDAFELRVYLECLAARKAAQNITPVQICLLEEQIQAEEQIFEEKDLEGYLEVNQAFHSIIAEASGNILLNEYISNILSRTFVYMVFFESFFDFDSNPSLQEHREIVEALRNRNEELVVKLLQDHISITEKQIEDLLK